jgi:hypothetical protein
MRTGAFVALVSLVVAASACKKEQAGDPAQPAGSGAAPAAATPSFEKLGIAPCDEYLEKYSKCLSSKVPEPARTTFLQGMKQTHDSWKQAKASNPGGLEASCKMTLDMVKKSMAQFNCEW